MPKLTDEQRKDLEEGESDPMGGDYGPSEGSIRAALARIDELEAQVAELRQGVAQAGIVLDDVQRHHPRSDCADWSHKAVLEIRALLERTKP